MLAYAFDKVLVEPLASRSFKAGQGIELFEDSLHPSVNSTRPSSEQVSLAPSRKRRSPTAGSRRGLTYKERKDLLGKIRRQFSRFTEERTSLVDE